MQVPQSLGQSIPRVTAMIAATAVATQLSTTIQYNTIQYNTIQYNTIQYNTIQCTMVVRSGKVAMLSQGGL